MRQKKYAVFTMDVETFADTECIRASGVPVADDLMDGLDEYIRIMDRHGIKNTLFTVGDLAPRIADRLRAFLANGHKLAMHSHTHIAPMSEPVEGFREKTRRAKKQMHELFGVEVEGFRAPCFSMDAERLKVLQELGFRYDSSHLDYRPARHTVKLDLGDYQQVRRGVFRREDFYEFGLSRGSVAGIPFPISGGGYLRLTPWWFTKMLLRQHLRKNDYYVFYLHPFELTKRKIPFIRQLRSYDQYYVRTGVRTYGRRVEKIIRMLQRRRFEFVTFEQLVQIMGNEQPAQPAA